MTDIDKIMTISKAYYNDKKQIQFRDKITNSGWVDMTQEPDWNWDMFDYRVKPTKKNKPKYRPFINVYEVIDTMKNGNDLVRDKRDGSCYTLFVSTAMGNGWGHCILEQSVITNPLGSVFEMDEYRLKAVTFKELCKHYSFIKTNKPCGIKL